MSKPEHPKRRRLAAMLALFLVGATMNAAEATASPRYEGRFGGQPDSRVSFRVISEKGERVAVRFKVRDILFYCESAELGRTKQVVSLGRMRARFTGPRTFATDRYHRGRKSGTERYYRVEGRIGHQGRKATGVIFAYRNPHDPPEGDVVPECSTLGLAPWKAFRTRDPG